MDDAATIESEPDAGPPAVVAPPARAAGFAVEHDADRYLTIPADIEEAIAALGVLGKLITGSKWERAAIVATYVAIEHGGDRRSEEFKAGNPALMSASAFAGLGIHGFTDRGTVTLYVKAWLEVVGERPIAGTAVKLPREEEFPTVEVAPDALDDLRRVAGLKTAAKQVDTVVAEANKRAREGSAGAREIVLAIPLVVWDDYVADVKTVQEYIDSERHADASVFAMARVAEMIRTEQAAQRADDATGWTAPEPDAPSSAGELVGADAET